MELQYSQEQIIQARKNANHTQNEASVAIGCSSVTFNRAETGTKKPEQSRLVSALNKYCKKYLTKENASE